MGLKAATSLEQKPGASPGQNCAIPVPSVVCSITRPGSPEELDPRRMFAPSPSVDPSNMFQRCSTIVNYNTSPPEKGLQTLSRPLKGNPSLAGKRWSSMTDCWRKLLSHDLRARWSGPGKAPHSRPSVSAHNDLARVRSMTRITALPQESERSPSPPGPAGFQSLGTDRVFDAPKGRPIDLTRVSRPE